MRKTRKKLKISWFILMFSLGLFPMKPALANSAEPPALIILVTDAPAELRLSLHHPLNGAMAPIPLKKETKVWESYFTFYYGMLDGNRDVFSDLVLMVEGAGDTYAVTLPESVHNHYNNLLTLDLQTHELAAGQSPWRGPLLVLLRVTLTLIIEGLIFWLFGYRQKPSWMIFLITNLITQTGLNLMISGPLLSPYWVLGLAVLELVVLFVEVLQFRFTLWEHSKARSFCFAVTANAASLVLGGLLISKLPI